MIGIDVAFDFRLDAGGKDPDSHSPTLRRYHRLLWSRPLPGGQMFDLEAPVGGPYLVHESGLGRFELSSDAVIATFHGYESTRPIFEILPADEVEAFEALGYTMGGMMVFPSTKVDNKMTINGARGFTRKIADRMDLTLECIRRHYVHQPSPLAGTLDRYTDFFRLFDSFEGYVDFFFLQDLVDERTGEVQYFHHFDDFTTPAIPTTVDDYGRFRERSIDFITGRNERIARLGL